MKTLATTVLAITLIAGSAAICAADSDAAYPGMYVKDSVITAKVKTKLLTKHPAMLSDVQVDTDRDGNVWLSGKVQTDEASRLAEQIASDTSGVRSVHNHIIVTP